MTLEDFNTIKEGDWIYSIYYSNWGEIVSVISKDKVSIIWGRGSNTPLTIELDSFVRAGLEDYLLVRNEKEKLALVLKYGDVQNEHWID